MAIGASAGGLDAVSELLDALPQRSGMAYIFVQHLAPGHASVLPEILSKRTDMPVLSAHDGQRIDVDHVYVIPPNTTLSLTDGHLRLDPREGGAPHKPVDILFTSLAREHAQGAIAVVLSGGDADGTLGVQEVKHEGGITFAQDPESARFPSMPQNAISTGCVDFVLPPKRIAQELTRLGGHPYLARATNGDGAKRVTDEPPGEESILRSIFRRLRASHGVDFTHYKRSTLGRRLARRMALQKIDELPDYLALLEADPIETAALYQDFLIRVTGFFRDAESFDALRHSVFPILTEGRAPNEPIRIWVPGCASGEEVYSIAICLMEYLGDRQLPGGVQIFGTDVSEAAIETARAGVYAAGVELEVSAERMERFFVKQEHGY
ncbi:MAG TPA: chemotaxis protein CheB, partial [Steroidobacteraceae bacterium]|nr:chemotaxis protein CheB [Steroidobacteraceae bacterium]